MVIKDLEQRMQALLDAFERMSLGEYTDGAELLVGEDDLGKLEEGVNFLSLDLQTLVMANKEKEASLVSQQKALAERLSIIEAQRDALANTEADLQAKLRTIEDQATAIRELSAPLLEIEDGIIALPLVGVVDSMRAMDIMTRLLDRITFSQSRCVILDITGVEILDTKTADYLMKVVQATSLVGARCVLTGMSPSVAQTVVAIGVDMKGVRTLRTLKDGLRDSLAYLGRSHGQEDR